MESSFDRVRGHDQLIHEDSEATVFHCDVNEKQNDSGSRSFVWRLPEEVTE